MQLSSDDGCKTQTSLNVHNCLIYSYIGIMQQNVTSTMMAGGPVLLGEVNTWIVQSSSSGSSASSSQMTSDRPQCQPVRVAPLGSLQVKTTPLTTYFLPCLQTINWNSFDIRVLLASSARANVTSSPPAPSLSRSRLVTSPNSSQPSLRL